MDALSHLLENVKVRSALCTRFEVSAPWGHEVANLSRVKFVLVLNGSCWLKTAEYPNSVRLTPGDLFFALGGQPYTLSDSQGSKVVDCRELEKQREGYFIRYGGSGALTSLISVALELETEGAAMFFSTLPAFIHLKVERARSFTLRTLIDLMENEIGTDQLASAALVQRLVEALFISALRDYVENCKEDKKSIFAAISHHQIGKVVKAMYAEPEKNWNLETLAQVAAMSRSAFATKFRRVSGWAPLEFLTAYRMSKSTQHLKGSLPIPEIASRVGYESEISFARAFKRVMKTTPCAFRKSLRGYPIGHDGLVDRP
jgi:AraC-like DNA-binding protein